MKFILTALVLAGITITAVVTQPNPLTISTNGSVVLQDASGTLQPAITAQQLSNLPSNTTIRVQ